MKQTFLRGASIKDIIIGTETLIKTAGIKPDVATKLRNMTIKEIGRMQDLEKRRPTKKNLTTKEWKAVKTIAADTSRRVVPADKGDKSIVTDYGLEALDHKEEEAAVLDEGTYLGKLQERIKAHTKIDANPAIKHEKKLNSALQKMHQVGKHMTINNRDKDNPLILSRESLLQYTTQGAIPPQLRGQIKDHKEGDPMREISDASRSPGHKLAKTLNKIFDTYTRQTKTAVNGGKQLIQFIREGRFNGNFLGSCDAVALYPSIIVEEGLELLERKILEDEDLERKTDLSKAELAKLTRLVTEELYFECEFGFFQQNGGTQMGGPLSRLLADLVIENNIEAKIAAHPRWGPIWDWVRLIDDTLSVWESEEIFLEFFEYLNNLHDSIKWTYEVEKDNKIAIFDILILRTDSGYSTTVYRKPAASDRYIHYTSAQAWKEKASAIRTLKARAYEYCSDEELLAEELSHLLQVFVGNGYPANTVWRILYQDNKGKKNEVELDVSKSLYAPYHPRARRLYNILKKEFGIDVIYKKTQTLGDIILKKGRQIEKGFRRNVVYSIPCAQCPKKYVGQTTATLNKRNSQHKNWCLKKHKKEILKSTKKNDGMAYHHHSTGHNIDFDRTEIITEEKNYWRRLIIEGMEIKKLGENRANRQVGYEIDDSWNPIIERLKS